MDFSSTFTPLYITPFVDSSSIMRSSDMMPENINQDKLSSEISDLAKSTYAKDNGISSTDSNYNIDNLYIANGIPYLVDIANDNGVVVPENDVNILFDGSDYADYNSRYVSLDAKAYRDDGTDIAFIQIMKNDKSNTVIFPPPSQQSEYGQAPGITSNKFKQFIVMQQSCALQERMQIVETNKEFQVLFFGKKAEILQVSGVLKNTIENPWSMNMIFLWDEFMRGTKLVENGLICNLYIDGTLYKGYPFLFQRTETAGTDHIVNFSFNFLIKNRYTIYDNNISYSQSAVSNINAMGTKIDNTSKSLD